MAESGHDDEPEELPEESAPAERGGSAGVSTGGGAPRMSRFGEGPEGTPARRERGLSGPREGFFGRVGKFTHDVRAELGRVSWPTALQVRNTTIITIIAVIFFAAYLYGVDYLFATVIERIQGWVGGAS
jgi:preprotein translocase subunit SecE